LSKRQKTTKQVVVVGPPIKKKITRNEIRRNATQPTVHVSDLRFSSYLHFPANFLLTYPIVSAFCCLHILPDTKNCIHVQWKYAEICLSLLQLYFFVRTVSNLTNKG